MPTDAQLSSLIPYTACSKHRNREILKGLDVSFLAAETQAPIVIHNYGHDAGTAMTLLQSP